MGKLAGFVIVLVLMLALPAAAEDIAFMEASSELHDGRPATNMYNAVDGRETTAWCSKAEDANSAVLSFGFDQPVTVTHLGIIVGAIKGSGLDKTNKRARIVYVADVAHRVEAKFRDDGAMQTLELSPPAKGRRIVIELADAYDGSSPNAPLCVAEVVLKNKNAVMTGNSVASKVRALNTPSKRLLHEWIDDVSAPSRTLLFNLDGTFKYRFEPLLEGKPAKLKGKWSAVDRAITLTIGGKSWRIESRLTKVEDGSAQTVELVLAGDAPHPSMAATFRPAPARLP
jgi:hypothetical protein